MLFLIIFSFLLFFLVGGLGLASAFTTNASKAAFERRKLKFAEGRGKNPEMDIVGPHKSFKHNMIKGGSIMGVIGISIAIVSQLTR